MFRTIALAATLLTVPACGDSSEEIHDRTVEVGCGMCRFHRRTDGSCYWAMRIDGEVVPVRGDAVPGDEGSHDPDGMCNVTREAIVSGTLYPTYFSATRFDLRPVAGAESPEFGPDDVHTAH
jgi:hypothetical protein